MNTRKGRPIILMKIDKLQYAEMQSSRIGCGTGGGRAVGLLVVCVLRLKTPAIAPRAFHLVVCDILQDLLQIGLHTENTNDVNIMR